jgi:hypothetical protein
MAKLINKDFTELVVDSSNYLTWAMDVKIVLTAKGYINTLMNLIHKILYQRHNSLQPCIFYGTISTMTSKQNT